MDTTTQIKEQLQQMHKALMGRALDGKALRFWTNAIVSGEKAQHEFLTFLLANEDCKQRTAHRVKDAVLDRVGALDEAEETHVCERFYEQLLAGQVGYTKEDVTNWVLASPEFERKYGDMVRHIYGIEYADTVSADCTQEVVDFYVSKFRSSLEYDVDALHADIKAQAHKPPAPAPPPPSAEPIVKQQTETETQAMPPQAASVAAAQLALRQDVLQLFEDTMKRPMYVHEYMKYHTLDADPTTMTQLCKTQRDTFLRLSEIYKQYLNQVLDEYTFVKSHLDMSDAPDAMVQAFKDQIIHSDTYETQMKMVIKRRYSEVYDEQLDEDDLTYVFKNKVQAMGITLFDESLSTILVGFKAETDEIIDHMYTCFMTTVGRQPDIYECVQWFKHYRGGLDKGYAQLDLELERELMMSLEYHDILKTKVKQVYQQQKGEEILPSQLFQILSRCISTISQCSSVKSIDAFIASNLSA